jgi:AbrB family looped-hinge helix DNA binding protein
MPLGACLHAASDSRPLKAGYTLTANTLTGNTHKVILFPMKTSRLTVKGQITVPKELRDAFGWTPHTELQFQRVADGVKLMRSPRERTRGERIVARLRGSGNRKLSTNKIMSWTRGER